MDPEAEKSKSQWLVILNQSLSESEIHRLLKSQQHRVRVSTGTLPHTCIFPQSSVAFMTVPITEVFTAWPPRENCQIDEELSKRLTKFSELRHRCYVLLCAPLLGSNEQKAVSALQQRFLTQNLHFLPVHNSNECVECMATIAKVTCKPISSMIQERFERVQEQLLSEENILGMLHQIGIGSHESMVLLDGCGSLAAIARATADNLLDCSLDVSAAQEVQKFFKSRQ